MILVLLLKNINQNFINIVLRLKAMSTTSEKLAFSQRLQQQLSLRHWPVNSPTWLAKEFNVRFNGASVSVQTASNWLSGAGIPNQEKLRVLADWLEVSSEWLRFGTFQETTKYHIAEDKAEYHGVRYNLADPTY